MTPLPDLSWFNTYHDYSDHRGFFEDLNAAFLNNSEIFTTGKSYQGRDIYGIHFWGKSGKGKKPAIYFHATVHAREWIATPVSEDFFLATIIELDDQRQHRSKNTLHGSSSADI